jgi:hypothetical protein
VTVLPWTAIRTGSPATVLTLLNVTTWLAGTRPETTW